MMEGSSVGLFYCFKTLQLSTDDFNAAEMFLLEVKGLREGSCVGLFYCFKTLLLSICDFNAAKMFLLELRG